MNPLVHITISYGTHREKSQSKAFEIDEIMMVYGLTLRLIPQKAGGR